MKKSTLILALSLVINAAFVAAVFLRPAITSTSTPSSSSIASEKSKPSSPAGSLTAAQLAALKSGDAEQMIAAGRAFAN